MTQSDREDLIAYAVAEALLGLVLVGIILQETLWIT